MSHSSSSSSATWDKKLSDKVGDARSKHAAIAQDYAEVFNRKMARPPVLKFEDVMGSHPDPYWWRLYIDPQHWAEALETTPANPGHLYDLQLSPGFQASMTKAYSTFLVSTGSSAAALHATLGPDGKPMTWEMYQSLWKAALPSPADLQEGIRLKKYIPGVTFLSLFEQTKPGNRFGCAEHLVADLSEELLTIEGSSWHLVAEENSADAKRAFSVHQRLKDGSWRLVPQHAGVTLQKGVDAVFQRFSTAIESAPTQGALLLAIAQAVRALHVMHTFSDGCGRVNVFMLLPAMMLRYGFGVPLGRRFYGKELSWRTIYNLFNGDYSVGTIAQVLHLTQDKGLLAPPKESILFTPVPEHSSSQSSSSGLDPAPANANAKDPALRPGKRGHEPTSTSDDPHPGPKKPAVHPGPVTGGSASESGGATHEQAKGSTHAPAHHIGVPITTPVSSGRPTTHGAPTHIAGVPSSTNADAMHEESSAHGPVVRLASVTSAAPSTNQRPTPASISHQTADLVLF